jgi:hypothetical protein
MARMVTEGNLINWSLSPLSIFGMYPFSFYPIGIPLFLGAIISTGASYEIAILVLSYTSCVVGVVGSFYLGKQLFNDENRALLFTIFYSFSLIFLRFTYFTGSARGPYLAVLPWILYFALKYYRDRKKQYVVIMGLLVLTQFLIHRLALFTLLYFAAYVIYVFTLFFWVHFSKLGAAGRIVRIHERVTTSLKNENRLPSILILIIVLGVIGAAYFVGLISFFIDPEKTTPLVLTNDTYFGATVNLIIDYGIRLGVLSIFLPIGVLVTILKNRGNKSLILHTLLLSLVAFTIPRSLYASVVFLPVFAYYSVMGVDYLVKGTRWNLLGTIIVAFSIIFVFLYSMIVVVVSILYLIGLLVFLGVSIAMHIANRLSKTKKLASKIRKAAPLVITAGITIFSLITMDGLILQDQLSYMSEDEKFIVDYLSLQDDPGITFVFSWVVGRRLEAYGYPAVRAYNEHAALYFEWLTPEEVYENTELAFDVRTFLLTAQFFAYTGIPPEKNLWERLAGLDLTNPIDYETALEMGLRFIVLERTPTGYGTTVDLGSSKTHYTLLESTPISGELVYEGELMSLFAIPTS